MGPGALELTRHSREQPAEQSRVYPTSIKREAPCGGHGGAEATRSASTFASWNSRYGLPTFADPVVRGWVAPKAATPQLAGEPRGIRGLAVDEFVCFIREGGLTATNRSDHYSSSIL